ncbi:glycosyltransferase family 61 protein [Paenibacillus thermotolerans]|uniref:glycosyltransferase family 61 protein n=1 Tax=Paenibacillus thermotolerans TaxID=3027807 RepID=UPI00236751EC|nr:MULTISPECIES: glycosyltransferase family 61 protein [unclassified Paenibacillus]
MGGKERSGGKPTGRITAAEWAESVRQDKRNYMRRFNYGEIESFSEAKALEETETAVRQLQSRDVPSPPAFVVVMRDGRVWGKDGVVITPEKRVLFDVSLEFRSNYLMRGRHSIFKKWKEYDLQETDDTVGVAANAGSDNYFHWLLDTLPRIELLRKCDRTIDKYLFRGEGWKPFHNELLDLLGIPAEKRMFTNDTFYLKARRLVVPSLAGRFTWENGYPQPIAYAKRAVDFLRNELLGRLDISESEKGRRLFISRANASRRKLVNEDEIYRIVRPLGFRLVSSESMPVAEQIKLFASAEAVVAPHGAGLANIVFCRPGTKVIELFCRNYTPGYFWMLSNHASLDYYYLTGEEARLPKHRWEGAVDYRIDPRRFKDVLKKAGL